VSGILESNPVSRWACSAHEKLDLQPEFAWLANYWWLMSWLFGLRASQFSRMACQTQSLMHKLSVELFDSKRPSTDLYYYHCAV